MEKLQVSLPKVNRPWQLLKEAQNELKKVSWPTKEETVRLTAVVIFASAVVALYVGGLDFIFTKLMELVVK